MAAQSTGNNILARARTIATQSGGDANTSAVIDSLGGARALLNNSIREVYRRKSNDQKFIRDTFVRHTVVISGGTGTCPDEIMREFLHQADFEDDNSSKISYMKYGTDVNAQTFDQLGYVGIQGDDFTYRAPSPDLDSYSGNLFVSVPSFPEFPATMDDPITFPSIGTIDDVVLLLASALLGKQQFEVVSV